MIPSRPRGCIRHCRRPTASGRYVVRSITSTSYSSCHDIRLDNIESDGARCSRMGSSGGRSFLSRPHRTCLSRNAACRPGENLQASARRNIKLHAMCASESARSRSLHRQRNGSCGNHTATDVPRDHGRKDPQTQGIQRTRGFIETSGDTKSRRIRDISRYTVTCRGLRTTDQ
jgi:hypothetical protein